MVECFKSGLNVKTKTNFTKRLFGKKYKPCEQLKFVIKLSICFMINVIAF
jgi:hypothetical protein